MDDRGRREAAKMEWNSKMHISVISSSRIFSVFRHTVNDFCGRGSSFRVGYILGGDVSWGSFTNTLGRQLGSIPSSLGRKFVAWLS